MLGVVDQPVRSSRDRMLIETANEFGYRFETTRIGVFRGEPGKSVPDPYFGGEGPDRAGCIDCGQCMVGCRHNAKNPLDKNYLWLAERRGVRVEPERYVTDIQPLDARDGSDGYAVVSERPGAWARHGRRTIRARGVIVAAGPIGTNLLLANCRHNGSLPALSGLGSGVRTNGEAACAVTLRDRSADVGDGVAITGSVWPSDDVHIESVTYGGKGDAMGKLVRTTDRGRQPHDAATEVARKHRTPPCGLRSHDDI